MITGEIKSQVDKVWNTFWSGGISNPLDVVEQITYLLFLKRLDERQLLEEKRANLLQQPMQNPVFPPGNDPKGRPYADLRWSRFKNLGPDEMFTVMGDHVFPFLRNELPTLANGELSTYSHHMRDAQFVIKDAGLLQQAVDGIDNINMDGRDTKGDLYEYMLSKLASAGTLGQYRTPRHVIDLMVAMTAPQPLEAVCDPAAGTGGFLVQTGEYLRENHPHLLINPESNNFFHNGQFHGFDIDSKMLRIGSMNMMLHGVENPTIVRRNSLAELHSTEGEKYDLILANPPFAGSLDYDNVAKDLLSLVKTKKTELLFMALFIRLLKPGGRAAVVVPDGVLFGSSKAHKELRKMIVEGHRLEAVVKLPSGVFRPYSGVSTAILFFTKTNSGGTDNVWFYDVRSDGFSLDDRRTPLGSSDLPDVLTRWKERTTAELTRARTDQSFCVPLSEIAENDYDLALNRYREIEHDVVEHAAPEDILAALDQLESQITQGTADLRELLK